MKDKSKKKVPTAPTVKKEVSEEELKKISGGQGYGPASARTQGGGHIYGSTGGRYPRK